jgi:hypothetical protein
VNRLVLIYTDGTSHFADGKEQISNSRGERDLAGFAFGRFRARDVKEVPHKIDIFPTLRQNLTQADRLLELDSQGGLPYF